MLAPCPDSFCPRRGKAPISGPGSEFLEESEEIFLGSRSKSPLYDEISIPFIDASLPPTPKGARSHNALEILLGRREDTGQLSGELLKHMMLVIMLTFDQ